MSLDQRLQQIISRHRNLSDALGRERKLNLAGYIFMLTCSTRTQWTQCVFICFFYANVTDKDTLTLNKEINILLCAPTK